MYLILFWEQAFKTVLWTVYVRHEATIRATRQAQTKGKTSNTQESNQSMVPKARTNVEVKWKTVGKSSYSNDFCFYVSFCKKIFCPLNQAFVSKIAKNKLIVSAGKIWHELGQKLLSTILTAHRTALTWHIPLAFQPRNN